MDLAAHLYMGSECLFHTKFPPFLNLFQKPVWPFGKTKSENDYRAVKPGLMALSHERWSFSLFVRGPPEKKASRVYCPLGRLTLLAQIQYKLRVRLALKCLHKNQLRVYDSMV